MDRDSNRQLELFSEGTVTPAYQAQRVDNPFVNFLRACEKKAWLAVAFIVAGVIAFTAGVERGRRMGQTAAAEPSRGVAIAAPADKAPAVKTRSQRSPVVAAAKRGRYTIQVGTYANQEYARQQALELKKKGFPAVTVKSGKHTLLCVGNFTDKEAAKRYAARFKGAYKSCLIRRF